MSTVELRLPNGQFVDVPSSMPYAQAMAFAKQNYPEAFADVKGPQAKGGFWGDVAGSTVSGIGSLVQFPGQLAGLAGADPNNAVVQAGKGVKDFGQSLKSDKLKEQELKLDLARQAAEKNGFSAEVAEALKQYASNPYLTFNMLVEQLPQLVASLGAGTAARVGVQKLAKDATEQTLSRAAVGGASGMAAAMQGSDVGAATYERVYNAAIARGFSEEDAKARATEEARKAALKAGAVSGVTMAALPGVEKTLLGGVGSRTAARGAARSGVGEAAQEALEEGSGAYFTNVGEQAVNPDTDTGKGVGFAGTTGAVFGGLTGAPAGAYDGARASAAEQAKANAEKARARALEASQEQERKEKEAAYKQTPDYLKEVDAAYTKRVETIADFDKQIQALGKPSPESAEALEKKQLREARAKYIKESEPILKEYTARKAEIARSKIDVQDFYMDSVLTEPTVRAGSPKSLKELREATKQREEAARTANPEIAKTNAELEDMMSGLQNYANISGGAITAEDINSKFTPDLLDRIQKYGLRIPGLDKATSDLIVKDATKALAKQRKAELTDTYSQRAADLSAQATSPTEPTDPLAMLKESMDQQNEFQNTGEQSFDYLDGLFEKALGEGDNAGVQKVAVPEGVRPVNNADKIVKKIDDLFAIRDQADKDTDLAFRSGNKEAGMQAAARREKAATELNNLSTPGVDTEVGAELASVYGESPEKGKASPTAPIANAILSSRKEQEAALADAAFLLDDLNAGRSLDAKLFISEKRVQDLIKEGLSEEKARAIAEREAIRNQRNKQGSASSTTETLKNRIDEARKRYVSAVIQEAATIQTAYGKALTKEDAFRAANQINRAFNEWMTRAAALPSEAVKEYVLVSPAQMRGTEIVKGAEYKSVDPRPLSERRLGAYRQATEVLQEQIKRIGAGLASVKDTGKRDEQLLRTQFAPSEAAKTAEARGETATTRGGELRRRREYVSDLINRALSSRKMLPNVRRALEKAQANIDDAGTDIVSGVPNQRFEAGLLDAAEELARRVLDGSDSNANRQRLIGEIEQATRDTEPAEGQMSLFDPAPLVKEQEASKARIEALTKQVDELKASKFKSLKEGVEAKKRIDALEKAIAVLQDFKKQGVDTDVRELRKEQTRLQSDLGYFRATATNFDKAPEVVKGRKAVETTRAIKKQFDRLDNERAALKNEIEDINARLSSFDWLRDAGDVTLSDETVAEKQRLEEDRKALAPKREKQETVETEADLASLNIRNRLAAVRQAYQAAIKRSMQQMRDAAMTPELAKQQEEADAAIKAAFVWLRDLRAQKDQIKKRLDDQKKDVARKEESLQDEENASGLLRTLGGMIPLMNQRAAQQIKDIDARISAEEERLERAEKALGEVQSKIREAFSATKTVAKAAVDKAYDVEKRSLDAFAKQLEEKGFVVDLDKGTVQYPTKKTAEAEQGELRRQKTALANAKRAQSNYAAEALALRSGQQGLGLGGTRRVDGRVERIKDQTELDSERREQQEEERKQRSEETATRKAANDAERAALSASIEAIRTQIEDKRKEIADTPTKRAKKPLEKELAALMKAMTSEQLKLDTVGKTRERKQRALTTDVKNAPGSLRAGTPESNVRTLKLRSDTPKIKELLKKQEEKLKNQDLDLEADTDIGDFGGTQDKFFAPESPLDAMTAEEIKAAKKHPTNGMKFSEAGAWLVRQLPSALKKSLANKVLQVLGNVPGTVEITDNEAVLEGHPARYSVADKKIYINAAAVNSPLLNEILLHELTHAGTVAGIATDESLETAIGKLALRVERWLKTPEGRQYLKDNPNALTEETEDNAKDPLEDRVYGILNPYEFVAETFSNPYFQELLKQVPSEKGTLRKIWDAFVNAIAPLFGAKHPRELNTLAEAIDLTEKAMLANWLEYETRGFKTDATFAAPKRSYESDDIKNAAETMIGGRNVKPLAEIREAATGLAIRTRFVDNYAALKEALKRGDATMAMQVTYDLMNFAQRNHIVQQAVMVGAPTRSWWAKEGTRDTYKTEAQEGASLKNVSALLGEVKGYGNAQGVSDAFTLLALGKRAQTEGWDRVFADDKNDSADIKAKKQSARTEADKLARELDEGKSPFAAAYKEYQAWNKGMLQFAAQAGVISDDEFRRLASKQNYTPLFRKDKIGNLVLELDQGRDITIGRLADEPHLVKLLGGSGQVMDFFTASVRNASILIDASLHNIASREAAFALAAMDAAAPASPTEKGENIIEFRKNGDLQRFAIDTSGSKAADIPTDLLVKGFAGVPASLPGFVRLMGVPAQILRKTVTRNPLYMMRQLIRDPLSSWLATGAKFNPITDTISELGKSIKGSEDKTLERRGITGGVLFAENETDLERIQNEAKNSQGWSFGYFMAKADHAAQAADAITRRNVYKGALKEGASELQATIAAYEAMPFSKRGTSPSVRYMNHMVPFLSAAIQGWDVLYRAAKGDMPLADKVAVRKRLLARGSMIAGLSFLYALGMADDEQYKNANTSERLNNWFVKLPGTDQTIKLPIPFELGVIFKMVPEAVARSMFMDKDFSEEMRAVGGALAGMAPNVLAPQAMLPVIEATLNKSFFTGRPIEGRALEDVDIGKRADASTSELSKLLGFDVELFGKQFGVSPKMFEYMASQYTAGIYPALAALVDTVLPAPTSAKPDRTLAEMPLFRSALVQENAGGETNRLYDKIEKFARYNATMKKLMESDPAEGIRYMQENSENVAKGAMANKMKAAIDKISNAENKVRNNPDLSSADKKLALDRFKQIKSRLATQFSAAI
jgi:hypothetical protein